MTNKQKYDKLRLRLRKVKSKIDEIAPKLEKLEWQKRAILDKMWELTTNENNK